MKCRQVPLLSVIVCVAVVTWGEIKDAQAAQFGNLGFEDGISSNMLPYWTCRTYLGNSAGYNGMALDSADVSIHDKYSFVIKPLVGNYSVLLQDGYNHGATELMSSSISQVGDIPSWAKSLTFKSDTSTWIDELQVSLNDTVIPFSLYAVDGTVNPSWPAWGPVKTYACDISAFAGDTDVTLKFEKLVHDFTNPNDHGIVDLDAITFSTIVSPEPSSLVLLAIGIFSLAGYYWRRRNRAT